MLLQLPAAIQRIPMPMPGPLEYTNCYLLTGPGEAVLVDTGIHHPDGLVRLDGHLREAGLSRGSLTGIILTHGHHDHFGLAAELQRSMGIPVRMNPIDIPYMRYRASQGGSELAAFADWLRRGGVPEEAVPELRQTHFRRVGGQIPTVDGALEDGDRLVIAGRTWEVLWTPGHSPGHVCLWNAAEGLLLSGDHVLPKETPNITLSPSTRPDPLADFFRSMHRVAALPARLIMPGHGRPFAFDPAYIQGTRHHHDVRLADVRMALAAVPLTGWEVANRIPWVGRAKQYRDLTGVHRWLAFGETLSHLAYLVGTGELESVGGNPTRYRLAVSPPR